MFDSIYYRATKNTWIIFPHVYAFVSLCIRTVGYKSFEEISRQDLYIHLLLLKPSGTFSDTITNIKFIQTQIRSVRNIAHIRRIRSTNRTIYLGTNAYLFKIRSVVVRRWTMLHRINNAPSGLNNVKKTSSLVNIMMPAVVLESRSTSLFRFYFVSGENIFSSSDASIDTKVTYHK